MIPPIFEIVKANAAATAFIGTAPVRFYPWLEAPQNKVYPYATYTYSGLPENYLGDLPDVDNFSTQVNVWAENGDDCINTARAIRDAVEPKGHMTSIGQVSRDPETKSYRI